MVLPYPSGAEEFKFNVQELLGKCDSPAGSEAAWYCLGYISGVSDIMGVNGGARSEVDKEASATLVTPGNLLGRRIPLVMVRECKHL
jgi:hypothetical protein